MRIHRYRAFELNVTKRRDYGCRIDGSARARQQALVVGYGRKVGICGQAPSDHPAFARFLADIGIDTISVTSDALPAVCEVLSNTTELEKHSSAAE